MIAVFGGTPFSQMSAACDPAFRAPMVSKYVCLQAVQFDVALQLLCSIARATVFRDPAIIAIFVSHWRRVPVQALREHRHSTLVLEVPVSVSA